MKHSRQTRRSAFVSVAAASIASLWVCVAARGAEQAPFSIQERPMPTGTDLAVLLPATVGSFKRDVLPPDARLAADEDLNIDYRSGGDTVNFGLSRPESVADAREAIKVSRDEAVASKVPMRGAQYSLTTDPAYFYVGDFVAWSRGQYFFYAKANSPAALDRFMSAFPF
jgi:hypothetical protein